MTTEGLRELVDTVAPACPSPTRAGVPVRGLDLPPDLPEHLGIADVADLTGLTAHTLRYYERIGLVDVARDTTGHRVYDHDALSRVVFVTRLRHSDMPIATITRYVELVKAGPETEPERLALLREHRAATLRRLHDLEAALAVIDHKITRYGGSCGS